MQRLAHLKQTRPETVKVDFTSTKRSEGKGNAKEARSGLCTLDPVHLDGADYAFPPPPPPPDRNTLLTVSRLRRHGRIHTVDGRRR